MTTRRYESKKKKQDRLLEALEKSLGVVTTACKACGLSRAMYYKYLKEEEFSQKVDEIQNVAIDFVESKLFQQIRDNTVASTIFYLKTKAKNRGYSERIEYDGNLKISGVNIVPYKEEKKDDEAGDKE